MEAWRLCDRERSRCCVKTTFAGCVRLRDVDMEPKPQQQMHVSRCGTSCTSAAMSSFLHSRRYSFSICIMHSDREREEMNRCDNKERTLSFAYVCVHVRVRVQVSQSVSQSVIPVLRACLWIGMQGGECTAAGAAGAMAIPSFAPPHWT